jgi:hypothetical protein
MPVLGAFAIAQPKLSTLLCGAVAGYLLIILTNPVRTSFRDGLRAIGRYRALWVILGVFGFAHALFQLALRVYFHYALPAAERPVFVWFREAWKDRNRWLSGTSESLWFLPRAEFLACVGESVLPTVESVAGIFNNLVTTFPLSAIAAVLLLSNWDDHHRVLIRALRKRFGSFGFAIHFGILLCALAAIAKPLVYVPQLFKAVGPDFQLLWFQWAPVVVWLSFLFEYLFGVCIQIYLILLAYVWIRGLTFTHRHLLDFAIRRFSYVVKWAAIVMLLSSLCIDAPLILKNFAPFSIWLPDEEVLGSRLRVARAALATFLLLGSTMQITLTFHSESWRKAMRDHLRFIARNWWPFAWYLIVAVLHFFFLHLCDLSIRRGLGEGTAPWILWTLVFPWLAGWIGAWLLASWACVYKNCEKNREDRCCLEPDKLPT